MTSAIASTNPSPQLLYQVARPRWGLLSNLPSAEELLDGALEGGLGPKLSAQFALASGDSTQAVAAIGLAIDALDQKAKLEEE